MFLAEALTVIRQQRASIVRSFVRVCGSDSVLAGWKENEQAQLQALLQASVVDDSDAARVISMSNRRSVKSAADG
jgi:hypothetical protein